MACGSAETTPLPSEQGLNTGHLLLQGLFPVGAGVDVHGGEDALATHGMHGLMAGLDRRRHRLPVPSIAVPLAWSWILRPASISTRSQAATQRLLLDR